LLILDPDDRPRTFEDVDAIVSAELPDENEQPLAYASIKRSMVHGPCRDKNGRVIKGVPCIVDGKCSKDFPKKFRAETSFGENDSYPQYRRREDGRELDAPHDCVITNAWIHRES
jgi:hypothetical protein